jgi:Ca2+-binding RTX toxin-like protein
MRGADGSLGHDVLVGGKGRDTLTGGKGVDWFAFNSVEDGKDVIRDFTTRGTDRDVIVLADTMFSNFTADRRRPRRRRLPACQHLAWNDRGSGGHRRRW